MWQRRRRDNDDRHFRIRIWPRENFRLQKFGEVIEVHWESNGDLEARAERGSKQLGARGLLEHFGIVHTQGLDRSVARLGPSSWKDRCAALGRPRYLTGVPITSVPNFL
jgi:hypothetical protein